MTCSDIIDHWVRIPRSEKNPDHIIVTKTEAAVRRQFEDSDMFEKTTTSDGRVVLKRRTGVIK